jgi:nucleotide-binding universal stress UspA family protein
LAISLVRGDAHVELVFCHAVDIPRMLAHADRFADDYALALEAARDEARRLLDRCVALALQAGIVARSRIRFGAPATQISSLAKAVAADLIVIGNRPSAKMHRFLCGSVRDEMVRSSNIPILVADANPSRPSEYRAGSILAQPADPPSCAAAARLASKIATAHGAKLMFLPPSNRSAPAAHRAVEQAVAEHDPGMIVLGAARKRGLYDVFSTGVVECVLQSAVAPVLIVHD